MPLHRESSQPRPRLRRPVRAALTLAAASAVVMLAAARWAPGWYADRLAPGGDAGRDARRLVTAVAGMRSTASRGGEWSTVIREEEINAWLATVLPRNHAAALPAGLSAPRVRLEAGRIHLAARASAGPFTGHVAVVAEARLRAADRLECTVTEARLGAIPLPAGPLVHRLAALFDRLGFMTELRRLDGRSVIVVSWGGRGTALRGLSVGDGEILIAGTTEEGR